MTWFRTDDDFPEHVKVDALEAAAGDWQVYAAARTVWHDMGCDCARRRTDGAFQRARAHRVCRLPVEVIDRALAALTTSGLVHSESADTYRFHDWEDYQPTKAELDHEKRLNADRQKAWRVRQREARAAKDRNAVTNGVTNAVTYGVTNGARNANQSRETPPVTVTGDQTTPRNGVPSRPVPSRGVLRTPSAVDDAGASPPAGDDEEKSESDTKPEKKPRRPPRPDIGAPDPASAAGRAAAALASTSLLKEIVRRPNALCAAAVSAYPAIDLAREIAAAEVWLVSNSKNMKSDGDRYLNGWLQRAQNRAPRVGGGGYDPPTSSREEIAARLPVHQPKIIKGLFS